VNEVEDAPVLQQTMEAAPYPLTNKGREGGSRRGSSLEANTQGSNRRLITSSFGLAADSALVAISRDP
jgi:hypothetical protein